MAKQRGSYPYPIVDKSDDVKSTFAAGAVSRKSTATTIEMTFETTLTDPDLQKYISAGRAGVRVRVSNNATFSAVVLEPTKGLAGADCTEWNLQLKQRNYAGRVEAEFIIVALEDLEDFSFSLQHDDYAGATFQIERGDILASAGTAVFDVDKWYDPLNPPIDSFVKIIRKPEPSGPLEVNLEDSDAIKILVPTGAYNVLGPRQNGFKSTLVGLTVAPVLLTVLQQLPEESFAADHSGKSWFESLRALLRKFEAESMEPLAQVQEILGTPFTQGITHLDETVTQIEAVEGQHE